jgi:hypothetical protein
MSDRDEKPPRDGEPLPPKIPQLPDRETRLERVINMVAQFFPDFLIIVRYDHERPIMWKSSDRTWAIGACQRFMTSVDECDRLQQQEQALEPPPPPATDQPEQGEEGTPS